MNAVETHATRGRSAREARTDVLHVVTSTSRRGAEVFGLDLAEALSARGRSVRIVALAPGPEGGRLAVPVLGRRRLGLRTLVRLHREARRSRVVVAHGSTALFATALTSLTSRRPYVYRNIGDLRFWLTSGAKRRFMRWVLRRASHVVALWEGSAETIRGIAGRDVPIRVIPTGVPAERYPPIAPATRDAARSRWGIAEEQICAVAVGSLSPEKNVGAAIEAVASLDGAVLLAVGAGPDGERLAAMAERLAPGRVRFLGAVAHPSEALAAADVLVLSSRTEGIPAVIIEAAFAGLPVVATAVGGVPTMVEDGRSGFLVPAGDVGALAAAVEKAAVLAPSMGAAGRSLLLERFEIGVVAAAWDSVLAEVHAWTPEG